MGIIVQQLTAPKLTVTFILNYVITMFKYVKLCFMSYWWDYLSIIYFYQITIIKKINSTHSIVAGKVLTPFFYCTIWLYFKVIIYILHQISVTLIKILTWCNESAI